jgi:hypothetical protein
LINVSAKKNNEELKDFAYSDYLYDLVKNNPVDKKINTVKSKNYSLGSPKNLELNILKKRLTKIR